MEPVSIRQGTVTPPIETSTFGQCDISLGTSPPHEPVNAPTELWLGSSAGFSFPAAGKHGMRLLDRGADQRWNWHEGERGLVPRHSHWQNDLAVGIFYISRNPSVGAY